ncbi:MAG TPA: M48 family metalloprotease [Acidobacteriaceae bacterium]|nr:M48 family metalloprotease [Acidobacteriaceae bacterium]
MRTSATFSLAISVLALSSAFAFAQKANSNADKPAAAAPMPLSYRAPKFSDDDRKKMAEIEQRPEIKAAIENAWAARRKADMDYVYLLNSTARFTDTTGPEYTTFVSHNGQLYNNPMLQRYLNNIGQKLVPKDSPNTYSFKLILDPMPKAEALSTGTILVSTGMVSMLDNEAQLSYVLGHEIAHVENNHEYQIVRMGVIEPALNAEKEKETKEKRALATAAVTFATGGLGGMFGGFNGAVNGGLAGLAGGLIGSNLIFRDHDTVTAWDDIYENDADEAGLHYMLDQGYDVREAPKAYARLQTEAARDPRIGLAFAANPSRMKARIAHIQDQLSGNMKEAWEAKLKAGGLTGSSGDFSLIMAALQRDNGIIAIDYDLFAMARDNLEQAVDLRSDDPRAQLYLGKAISLSARTPQDRQEAEDHFMKAIQYDGTRGAYPDPHLEHALHLISEHGDKTEIKTEIEAYVALFQREHAGRLPANMAILYDYLTLQGDTSWYLPPAEVVSTKNVDSIRTASGGGSTQLNGPQVIASVLDTAPAPAAAAAPVAAATTPEPAPAPAKAKIRKTSATAK